MMAAFFSFFPQVLLAKCSGLLFVPMAASLINDESGKCRKLISLAINSLLGKIEHNSRTRLYGIIIKWFVDEKLKHRTLAAQLWLICWGWTCPIWDPSFRNSTSYRTAFRARQVWKVGVGVPGAWPGWYDLPHTKHADQGSTWVQSGSSYCKVGRQYEYHLGTCGKLSGYSWLRHSCLDYCFLPGSQNSWWLLLKQ